MIGSTTNKSCLLVLGLFGFYILLVDDSIDTDRGGWLFLSEKKSGTAGFLHVKVQCEM